MIVGIDPGLSGALFFLAPGSPLERRSGRPSGSLTRGAWMVRGWAIFSEWPMAPCGGLAVAVRQR